MSDVDRRAGDAHGHAGANERPPDYRDGEVDARQILLFGAGLGAIVLVALVLMALLVSRFAHRAATADPRPSPLPEAHAKLVPPEPRLQVSPPADMRAMRTEQSTTLTTYGWVDEKAGIARIPIARAEALLLAREQGRRPK